MSSPSEQQKQWGRGSNIHDYSSLHCDRCNKLLGMADIGTHGDWEDLCIECYIAWKEELEDKAI